MQIPSVEDWTWNWRRERRAGISIDPDGVKGVTSATVDPFLRGWIVFELDAFRCVDDVVEDVVVVVVVATVLEKGDVVDGVLTEREFQCLLVGVNASVVG